MPLRLLLKSVLSFVLLLTAFSAAGDEQADITELEKVLSHFLANTERRSVHDAFWSEDLIYTSSAGTRQGKDEILSGFSEQSNASTMGVSYSAEDVTTRLFGDMAVVTFRLVATENGARTAEFFNTGVFRRDGAGWKAFTWQATKLPQGVSISPED